MAPFEEMRTQGSDMLILTMQVLHELRDKKAKSCRNKTRDFQSEETTWK